MAKIKFGALMVDARGKLGGHVFSKNRGGAYMRTKVTPTNPQASAQMAVRLLFGAIASSWSSLAAASRESWNNAVQNFTTTDIFGDLKTPSGKALYQRLNQNLALSGQAQLSVAPSLVEVPTATLLRADAEISISEFNVETVGDSTGSVIVYEATPPLSQGTSNANNRFRVITTSVGGAGGSVNIYDEYVAKFGALTAGDNVQVRIKFVNSIGLASPIQKIKALIEA